MPLATELTSLLLDGVGLRDNEDLQAWLASFKKRLAAVEGGEATSGFVPNVEQLFDFAKFDEELWRMRQQLAPVGRKSGATPWSQAEDISAWLSYMEEDLAQVIGDAQQRASLEPIERFTSHLSSEDTVLTFNYDTLVECALSAQGKAWSHGLDDRGDGGVTVLKMHGSIDWIVLERRSEKELQNFVRLFSKKDNNVDEHGQKPSGEEEYDWELWRAKDIKTCSNVLSMHKGGLSNFPYFLGLAGLGRYKPLHKLPGTAPTWLAAFEALKEAREIYVIGFSMSPYDTMARFHFTSVIAEREKPLTKAMVIDPNASSFASTFSSVFRRQPIPIVSSAEDIEDWSTLLG